MKINIITFLLIITTIPKTTEIILSTTEKEKIEADIESTQNAHYFRKLGTLVTDNAYAYLNFIIDIKDIKENIDKACQCPDNQYWKPKDTPKFVYQSVEDLKELQGNNCQDMKDDMDHITTMFFGNLHWGNYNGPRTGTSNDHYRTKRVAVSTAIAITAIVSSLGTAGITELFRPAAPTIDTAPINEAINVNRGAILMLSETFEKVGNRLTKVETQSAD